MLVLFVGAPLERHIRERARLTPAEAADIAAFLLAPASSGGRAP